MRRRGDARHKQRNSEILFGIGTDDVRGRTRLIERASVELKLRIRHRDVAQHERRCEIPRERERLLIVIERGRGVARLRGPSCLRDVSPHPRRRTGVRRRPRVPTSERRSRLAIARGEFGIQQGRQRFEAKIGRALGIVLAMHRFGELHCNLGIPEREMDLCSRLRRPPPRDARRGRRKRAPPAPAGASSAGSPRSTTNTYSVAASSSISLPTALRVKRPKPRRFPKLVPSMPTRRALTARAGGFGRRRTRSRPPRPRPRPPSRKNERCSAHEVPP